MDEQLQKSEVEGEQKKPVNRSPRCTKKEAKARVDEICSLLKMGVAEHLIVRQLSEKWGVGTRAVKEWYLSRARDRFRQIAGVTQKEARGVSLDFWADRLRLFALKERHAEESIATLKARESELMLIGRKPTPEDLAELEWVSTQLVREKKDLRELRALVNEIQDRRDRIYGTLAPMKIAETDAEGNDRPRSPEEIRVALVSMGVAVPALPMDTSIPVEFTPIPNPVEMPR
jgi:hypothetical protein